MQLTFTSTAGQYLALSVVEPGTASSSIQSANITVLNPDGTTLTTGTFTARVGSPVVTGMAARRSTSGHCRSMELTQS